MDEYFDKWVDRGVKLGKQGKDLESYVEKCQELFEKSELERIEREERALAREERQKKLEFEEADKQRQHEENLRLAIAAEDKTKEFMKLR